MDKDSKFTRDENGYVAIRTVSAPYSSGTDDKDSMFTRDENGYVAVRTTGGSGGGGGSDPHNLGWYATQSALETAHPTATAGDWAIVGSTDTVWIWDTDNSEWVDSDQKGQVTSVNGQTGAVTVSEVPSQTGNAGKFLTTDGTDASWGNTTNPINVTPTSLYYTGVVTLKGYNNNNEILQMSMTPQTGQFELDIRNNSNTRTGWYYFDSAFYPNQTMSNLTLGKSTNKWDNVYTTKINNGADITVPTVAGSIAIQVSTVPTADSTLEGKIYQYVGATDSTYTNGHFYKCVSDGANPATYSWTEVSMGGGSSYTAGTGIDITNDTISVASPVARLEISSGSLVGSVYGMWAKTTIISPYRCLVLGHDASISSANASGAVVLGAEAVGGNGTVTVGGRASATVADGIAIGNTAKSSAQGAVQIGYGTNSTSNTFQWKSYRLVSSDGTIPTERLTKVNASITLAAADWSSNTQTVNVTGMTATGVVFPSPDPADQSAYTSAGILCTAQAAGTLTFTCDTVPSGDIDVNVVML